MSGAGAENDDAADLRAACLLSGTKVARTPLKRPYIRQILFTALTELSVHCLIAAADRHGLYLKLW